MRQITIILLISYLGLTVACSGGARDAAHLPDPEPHVAEDQDLRPQDAREALDWLMAGNHRFWDGHPRHDHESMRRVAMLKQGQHPFATVLGCADSRVSPELVFDHGLGDMFVIRVAGNVVAEDEAGSIEYALAHLDVPLLVVLGHEDCGAVTAALHATDHEPAELQTLIGRIRPALEGLPPGLSDEELLPIGVEANVRQSVRQLREVAARVGPPVSERVLIVGAIYDLDTGKVRILEG